MKPAHTLAFLLRWPSNKESCPELPVASLLLLAIACAGDGTGPITQGLTGSYAASFNAQAEVLTVHLRADGGAISGFGWSTISEAALSGMSITGTYSGSVVQFDLLPSQGLGPWHFVGELRSDTLRGDFALVPGAGFQVALPRVDTVPTGQTSLDVSGALNLTLSGGAVFGYEGSGSQIALAIRSTGTTYYWTRIVWTRSTVPPPGTYSIGNQGGIDPTGSFVRYAPAMDPRALPITNGTIVVEASDRFALIGRLDLSILDPATSLPSIVRGSFSAGCIPVYSPC